MNDILTIIAAVFIFGVLVSIHELGHFIFARLSGIKVIEFCIGMGPRIVKYDGKETIYSIRALPIGGACMMQGEDDDDLREGSFNSAPLIGRIATVAAGPIFNFILAFFMALFIVANVGTDLSVVETVADGYPAQEAGIQSGDIITYIDNQKITIYEDMNLYFYMYPGKTVDIKLNRPTTVDGQTTYEQIEIKSVTPKYDETTGTYRIGISATGYAKVESISDIIYYSAYQVQYNISLVLKSLLMIVKRQVAADDIAGPVGIIGVIGETVSSSTPHGILVTMLSIASLMLLLSANLGVMNLLPIPALDGGRLLFLFIEAITRRPINKKIEGYIHIGGFVLLMGLMALICFNDIRQLFF